MINPYEELSTAYGGNGEVNTDANLSLDSLMLGGIDANDYALKSFVSAMAINVLSQGKQYTDQQVNAAKQFLESYTDNAIASQDFSRFATKADLNAAIANEVARCTAAINAAIAGLNMQNYVTVSTFNSGISGLQSQIDQLFQYVSNGKQLIASAITDKGVQAGATETFAVLAQKILAIPQSLNTSDATAYANDIRTGKSAYARGSKIYGTYYDETGSVATSDATANPADIKLGETAYVNGQKIIGTLDVSTGISDISSAVTKIYSTVLDKVALDSSKRITGSETLQTMYSPTNHAGTVGFVITAKKVEGVNKIIVEVPGLYELSGESVRYIKTFNATEFGVPADTEQVQQTIKYIYVDTTSPYHTWLIIVAHDGTKYTIYMSDMVIDRIQDDSGRYYNLLKPGSIQFDGKTFVETTREISNRFAIKFADAYTFYMVGVDFTNSGLHNCYMYIKKYNLLYGSSVYGNIIQESDTLTVENNYDFAVYGFGTIPRVELSNGSLLSIEMGSDWRLIALDEFGYFKGHKLVANNYNGTSVHVNNSGTKAIHIEGNKLVRDTIVVDYTTGDITLVRDAEYYQDEYFEMNQKILYGNPEDTYVILLASEGGTWESKPTVGAVYGLDFESNDILHQIGEYSDLQLKFGNMYRNDNVKEKILSNGTYCYVATDNDLSVFYTIPDYTTVIGLEYEGYTYYKLSELGLSAKKEDVLYGKTFVGKDGIKQVGTKVVVE